MPVSMYHCRFLYWCENLTLLNTNFFFFYLRSLSDAYSDMYVWKPKIVFLILQGFICGWGSYCANADLKIYKVLFKNKILVIEKTQI